MPNSVAGIVPIQLATGAPDMRRKIIMQNLGDYPIYFGRTSSVTTSTGIQIRSGGHFIIDTPLDHRGYPWIVSSEDNVDVRWELIG